MKRLDRAFFILLMAVLVVACVPAKKLHQTEDLLSKSNTLNDELTKENEELTTENKESKAKIDLLEKNIDKLIADSVRLNSDIYDLRNKNQSLEDKYNELQLMQDALIKGNAKETRRILSELQKSQSDLQNKEDALRELERKLNQWRKELNDMQDALNRKEQELNGMQNTLSGKEKELEEKNRILTEKNAKLQELESILAKKDSVLLNLKNRLLNALVGYKDKGLSISYKNGKVYVSMDEKLLFRSGSTTVGDKGKKALRDLAKVLESNPDIQIMVEGHTDDVPYLGKGKIKDNWDLSVLRATTVTRILLEKSKIDPARITSAGRSKYIPLEKGKSTKARQKNRRTEIVLTPNLDELFKLAETN
jgi:chemotaxis protein MotB